MSHPAFARQAGFCDLPCDLPCDCDPVAGAGDLQVARRLVLEEKAQVSKLQDEAKVRDLVQFCLSEDWAVLREALGLAPGAHGANRTGRPFTGDHAGWLLYDTLKKTGFETKCPNQHDPHQYQPSVLVLLKPLLQAFFHIMAYPRSGIDKTGSCDILKSSISQFS